MNDFAPHRDHDSNNVDRISKLQQKKCCNCDGRRPLTAIIHAQKTLYRQLGCATVAPEYSTGLPEAGELARKRFYSTSSTSNRIIAQFLSVATNRQHAKYCTFEREKQRPSEKKMDESRPRPTTRSASQLYLEAA